MPTPRRKHNSNEVIVNTKSNFKSHLVRCQSILDNTTFDEVVIKAMGKATTRAANLAVHLNANNFNTFHLESKTYTVDVIEDRSLAGKPIKGANKDGFNPDAIDTTIEKKTHIPAIVIRVRKNELEIKSMATARKRGLLKEEHN